MIRYLHIRMRCWWFRQRALFARDTSEFLKWRMRLQAERARLG